MMISDVPEPEPPVQAPPLGEDQLGAPERAHDAAFSTFYLKFMPTLVRFLRWHGAPLADAADVAQETMAQLYRHWPTVQLPGAWARRVASRRWGRRIADGGQEHSVDDGVLELAGTSRLLAADDILAFEQHHDVLRLLDSLPPRQRQILAWTYDGYTPSQIAEELSLTPETVRANLLKARRAAAAHLRKEGR